MLVPLVYVCLYVCLRVFHQVNPVGCIGGRKMPDNLGSRDFIVFKDSTVSRKHFEVIIHEE